MPTGDAVRQVGVMQNAFYRWRELFGGMGREQLNA
jgi:putative transposase